VVVTEMGGTLRSYSLGDRPVLDGFGAAEWSQSGRGQVLAPWPNRLGDGRYEFQGISGRAAIDEPEKNNAIHGLARWRPWELESWAQNRLSVRCVLYPTPGYPFTLELRLTFQIGREGLTVVSVATNRGAGPLPFGLGFHPYLTVGSPRIDLDRLEIPATERLQLDDRGLPTGARSMVVGSDDDFTVARPVGSTVLDGAFTALRRGTDGLARARLEDAGRARSVELWVDESFPYLMCFTGDTVGQAERRRQGMAIEPMTCPPDALRSGTDVVVLEPGRSWEGRWGLTPE
jgi:aldose 1-epimerase